MRRRSVLSLLSLAPVIALAAGHASAQQLGEGMDRSGVLDIHDEKERGIFGDLQCTCGCPRESLATCTCPYAAGFRGDVRLMMARGLTREEIKAEWVRQHGLEALTVPSNAGANRLLYLVPIAAIAGMGTFAGLMLRRFRRRSDAKDKAAPVVSKARDDYDDKLDEELRRLDDE